jgi:hypothetical protein
MHTLAYSNSQNTTSWSGVRLDDGGDFDAFMANEVASRLHDDVGKADFTKVAVTASAYELTPIDKQRLGNLYLELGRLREAHRWYAEYLQMMNYLTESNPRHGVWVEALVKLGNEAGE